MWALDNLIRRLMPLVTTLLVVILMSDVPVAMTANVDGQLSARRGLSSWCQPDGLAPLSLLLDPPAGESGGEVGGLLRVQEEHHLSDDGNTALSPLRRDWRGRGRDTAFFRGYQGVVAGVLYLLPESVTKWTPEQRKTSMRRWWETVQHPQWDKDNWYVNYLGHLYFIAIAYIRARQRRFGTFGSFWYAAALSRLDEFGIEALFEQPSYQDLIVTPRVI
jgi:hypothetical protein